MINLTLPIFAFYVSIIASFISYSAIQMSGVGTLFIIPMGFVASIISLVIYALLAFMARKISGKKIDRRIHIFFVLLMLITTNMVFLYYFPGIIILPIVVVGLYYAIIKV